SRHAKRVEISRDHRAVIGCHEVAKPRSVIPCIKSDSRSELVLESDGCLPAVRTNTKSAQELGIVRGHGNGGAETEAADLTAFTVDEWILQIAIREEILVRIRPRARHIADERP